MCRKLAYGNLETRVRNSSERCQAELHTLFATFQNRLFMTTYSADLCSCDSTWGGNSWAKRSKRVKPKEQSVNENAPTGKLHQIATPLHTSHAQPRFPSTNLPPLGAKIPRTYPAPASRLVHPCLASQIMLANGSLMGMGQNPVPLVNIPKMIIVVFIGMFTYPILMVIGSNPWPDGPS